MKKIILYFFFLNSVVQAQTSYKGFIDKYPIELVTNIYSDGVAYAFYTYTKFDEPIKIDGTIKDKVLSLNEKDSKGNISARLIFTNFEAKDTIIEGFWQDEKTKEQFKISLTKEFDVKYDNDTELKNIELLQQSSLKNSYFRLILNKTKEDFYASVTGIKIFEKKTDKLLQYFEVDCQLWGINNISTGDYNFDGFLDFSIFEQSYAGPNTSSVYFLYLPKQNKLFQSTFEGTSLEFDNKTKRIYEYNQCCAGRSHVKAEYKVVNNNMILLKRSCYEMDETEGDLKKIPCK